jgi:Flp pilus assembly protein TadD
MSREHLQRGQLGSLEAWLGGTFVGLLLNTAYLAAFASPSLFYFANVALHLILGVVLTALGLRWLRQRGWRLPLAAAAAVVLLAIGAGAGLAVSVVGATRAYRWLLDIHALASIAGAIPLFLWLASVIARQPARQSRMAAGALLVVVFGAALAAGGWRGQHSDRFRIAHRIANPTTVPARMEEEGAGPHSPFFPSSADTNVRGIIPANFFLSSKACGRCHRDIYEQWNASAHHFSSFNNQWYRKSIEYMQDVVGTRPSKWCAGCHDHAVFFNGRFDRPIKEQIETPEAQAGLACTSCHSIVHVGSSMGQGDFTIEYPPMHDLATSEHPVIRRVHDALLYMSPEPHRNTFIKPFHREQTAEFCSSCHKVHLDVPVNGYRWFRGFNDYDNWQASGVSGQGARSFYYPPRAQKCTDCHMPLVPSDDPAAKDGKVRSHRFPGANTALPHVNGDPVQLKTVQDFLKDGQISVDLFGIVRTEEPTVSLPADVAPGPDPSQASMFAVGEEASDLAARRTTRSAGAPAEVLAPIDKLPLAVRRGESVRLEVVVRTRKVGHFFPGGTVDAFDVWVELEAVDDKGRVLLHSGSVANGGRGAVEPGAHFYRSLQLDEHGNQINKRNAWMARSVAYVRLIPPGAADTIHYRLRIPADAGDRITLRAKVNYRKFAWWYTQWAFAGVRDPSQANPQVTPSYDDGRWLFTGDTSKVSGQMKAVPDIPTTVMAQAEASIAVIGRGDPLPDVHPFEDVSVRERWNDYGIGLLLQGDLKGAEATFRKVMAMDPSYADGPVNVARAEIQEGDVAAAIPMLEKSLAIAPRLAKAHYFLGTALKTLGRYDEALRHLRAAADQYPRDRVVLNQLGRVQFLQRRFDEAIATLQRVLQIDPEDLQAHYNLMLCYRGAGNETLAAREEALYTRFKADEAAQAITGPYRLASPHDNNERQQIHEHRGTPQLPNLDTGRHGGGVTTRPRPDPRQAAVRAAN